MFQIFDQRGVVPDTARRVAQLRHLISEAGLTGFLVPRADEHQGEHVPASAQRLRWLSGFNGSAGTALVMRDGAVLFVDGRYTLQAGQQADPGIFQVVSSVETPPAKWIRANLGRGARIGFDPWLHTIAEVRELKKAGARTGVELVAVDNLVDAAWSDRPLPPSGLVSIHPIAFAGELAKEKLKRLGRAVAEEGATHAVLTDPASLAWAFNIRGSDVPHTPLPLGFAILAADGRHRIFMDPRKLSIELRAYLTQLGDLEEPEALLPVLVQLARSGGRVALDPALAAEKLRLVIEESGGAVVMAPDPARLPRATKNGAEIAGARAAHRRDGAALAKFLCWLDRQEPGSCDEVQAVRALEEFRREVGEAAQMPLREIAFDTISGSGPNGAIIHYRVSPASNRRSQRGELFLIDSGGQYQDGTTDVTRTVPIGEPSEEMRRRFTLVLKGMIGISMLRFPPGTRGCDIDAVARLALWKAGLDYAHGTGHGVGSFLSVHEGPQRIAKSGTQRLLEGMILSNEPGSYRKGEYGIRIENLILVTAPEAVEGGEIAMHGFETLTLAPIDRRLIDPALLSDEERDWLDAYHARVLGEIGPLLDGETLAWLESAAAPLQPVS